MTGVPDYIRNMKLDLSLNGQLQAASWPSSAAAAATAVGGGEGLAYAAYTSSAAATGGGGQGVIRTLPRSRKDYSARSYVNPSSVAAADQILLGQNERKSQLEGSVDLAVALDLPGPLAFLPGAAISVVGNSILQSILAVMYDSLMAGLVDDYNAWLEQ